MKLKKYLENNGIKSSWLAKKIPCSLTYLCSIAAGRAKPSLIIRMRIAALTDGKVTEDDFEIEEQHG